MRPGLFVTGTDTGVGKTLVSAALVDAFVLCERKVAVMKPVASGCAMTPQGLVNEDASILISQSNVAADYRLINPYAFEPAIAPHLAAAEAGVMINLDHILDCYQRLSTHADIVIVEGAGGWQVPLGEQVDSAELARRLGLPVVLVVGMRLGCLNHALLSAQAIEAAGLILAGWVANEIDSAMARLDANVDTLRSRLAAPCLGHIRFDEHMTAGVAADVLDLKPLEDFLS